MRDLTWTFSAGGVTMWWIALLALPAVGLAIVHAIAAQRWSLAASVIVAVLIAGTAIFGTLRGRRLTDDGVQGLAEAHGWSGGLDRLRAKGYDEAMRPVQFGGIVLGAIVVPLAVGQVRRRARRA